MSVITPVYNGEDYLDECIASVVAQTYPDWRYTIVDNCSDDGSAQIAADWAQRDHRIRVVTNPEFLGQVENFNRALTLIDEESRWTKMVLADDWIFPRCLERMVEIGEARPTIGIVGAYRLDDRQVNLDGLPWCSEFVPGREVARAALLEHLFVSGSPNSLLYRSDVVRARDPFFPLGAWHEDTEVFLELMGEHDLGFVHEVLTFTRRENESLTTKIRLFDPEHSLDKLIATMKYGPGLLDDAEFEACRSRDLRAYYDFLGRTCIASTAPGFWNHQHEGLRRAGLEFERGRFVGRWAIAMLRFLANPARVARRIGRVFQPRSTAPGGAGEA